MRAKVIVTFLDGKDGPIHERAIPDGLRVGSVFPIYSGSYPLSIPKGRFVSVRPLSVYIDVEVVSVALPEKSKDDGKALSENEKARKRAAELPLYTVQQATDKYVNTSEGKMLLVDFIKAQRPKP